MLLKDHADLGLLLRQMLAAAHAAGAGCSRPRYGFARFPHIVGARSSVTLHPGLNKDGTYRFTVRLLDSEFEPTRHCAPRPHCRCCTDPLGSCSCTLADDAKECARCAKETLAAATGPLCFDPEPVELTDAPPQHSVCPAVPSHRVSRQPVATDPLHQSIVVAVERLSDRALRLSGAEGAQPGLLSSAKRTSDACSNVFLLSSVVRNHLLPEAMQVCSRIGLVRESVLCRGTRVLTVVLPVWRRFRSDRICMFSLLSSEQGFESTAIPTTQP